MKRLGLIGGTTWHSTAEYYRLLNEGVQARLGGVASAELMLASVNFAEIAANNDADDHVANGRIISAAADRLRAGGAEGLLLCANTMHMYAEDLAQTIGLPLIHIVDAVARVCHANDFSKVALLGTRFTMEMDFFRDRLSSHGLQWSIPSEVEREFIHATIFAEMAKGVFTDEIRAGYVEVIDRMAAEGAQAVILGCTELPILIRAHDVRLPTLDTTAIHVDAALEWMLG